jgi:hypothetical protein
MNIEPSVGGARSNFFYGEARIVIGRFAQEKQILPNFLFLLL